MRQEKHNPVEWNRLKQVQDESQNPKLKARPILGLLFLLIAAVSFIIAILAALDPREHIEPARYFFITLLSIAILSTFAGWFLIHDP
jgi:hypothetical protein